MFEKDDLEFIMPMFFETEEEITTTDKDEENTDTKDSNQEKEKGDSEKNNEDNMLPMIPLRDIVMLPDMVFPILVGRKKSLEAIKIAEEKDSLLFLSAQKDGDIEEPEPDDIYKVGVISEIIGIANLPNNMVRLLVIGKQKAEIEEIVETDKAIFAKVKKIPEPELDDIEREALTNSLRKEFSELIKMHPGIPDEFLEFITNNSDIPKLVGTVMANLKLTVKEKQKILEMDNPKDRLVAIISQIGKEKKVLELEQGIAKKVMEKMEKIQKEYILNEQLKEIRKELGLEEEDEYITQLKKKAKKVKMTKEAREKFKTEIERLKRIPPMSPEYTVISNYLEWLVELPWGKFTKDQKDIKKAKEILEKNHYGLEKVKDRILDFIAVRQLSKSDYYRGPILCLAGPPGTGKTSLAKSIAEALGRNFVRLSLGGVRDEAEIRGHRRTYVGAMPGRIIQMMKKAQSQNPVFLLDEVDKMSADFRGDPSAALLEVLDPEQNHAFMDHYLGVEFDLSKVFFITTANNLYAIPQPLRDRMEIINIPGYTEIEKKFIAKYFLIPKNLKENNLDRIDVKISDKAILEIIRSYTREAGVRELDRQINRLARKIARRIASGNGNKKINITTSNLEKYLGVRKYDYTSRKEIKVPGVATGLAWTESGGDVLYVEVLVMKGKGNLTLTGQLGDVMKESAQAAHSYARSIAKEFDIPKSFPYELDVHIHIPEGAIPKDGPSAGITMLTALVSALSGKLVRDDIAMTGEITLTGEVLPIGGLKEKLLAAKRAMIPNVIIPKKNEKDLKDVPEQIKKGLNIIFVNNAKEVLELALKRD